MMPAPARRPAPVMMMGINAEWTLKELCELAGTLAGAAAFQCAVSPA
jgi:hypothetical protein